MFDFLKKKPAAATYTLKPSDKECVELARLYDTWNAHKTMSSKVEFLNYARSIVKKYEDQIPFKPSRFNYNTEDGYIDVSSPLL